MSEPSDRTKDFEARLANLKRRMEQGLLERARELRDAASRLDNGDAEARREIKRHSHRLRGIAGTYGHSELTDLAADLERRASLSAPPKVAELARELAAAAERAGSETAASTPIGSDRPGPSAQERRVRLSSERPPPKPDGEALRVLAVDDDPLTLRLLTLTLTQVGGFQATIVESAEEALGRLAQGAYDLVLTDAMMPDMNGLEFCQAARALGGTMTCLPIIILSAATADELGWQGRLDAHTCWVRKPFRPSELVQRIAKVAMGGSVAADP